MKQRLRRDFTHNISDPSVKIHSFPATFLLFDQEESSPEKKVLICFGHVV